MARQTSPVDTYTYERAHKVLANARARGFDPVEALARAGLLLHVQMERDLKAEMVMYLLSRMRDYRVADFLRRKHKGSLNQRTPSDLYDCITDWLEDLVPALRKGQL